MILGVGSEGSGSLQNFLQTEILKDSLGDKYVELSVEASAEVELHKHVPAALAVSTLEEVLP